MKTFKEFVEKIEKDNDVFNSLSKQQKKVEVCKDVLMRLRFDNITPKSGRFYTTNDVEIGYKPAKTLLNSCTLKAPVCNCCAKGALFLSYIGRVNNYDFKYSLINIDDYNCPEADIMSEVFSEEELDAIEIAFEGASYTHIISNKEKEKVLAWRKKLKQGNTEKGSKKILKSICNNIIKNNGKFVY